MVSFIKVKKVEADTYHDTIGPKANKGDIQAQNRKGRRALVARKVKHTSKNTPQDPPRGTPKTAGARS